MDLVRCRRTKDFFCFPVIYAVLVCSKNVSWRSNNGAGVVIMEPVTQTLCLFCTLKHLPLNSVIGRNWEEGGGHKENSDQVCTKTVKDDPC